MSESPMPSQKERRANVSLACPFCKDPLFDTKTIRCPSCGTAHHLACWKEHGYCSVFNCPGKASSLRTTANGLLPVVAVVFALLSFAFVLKDHYLKKNKSATTINSTPKVVAVQPEPKIAPTAPTPAIPTLPEESPTVADARGMMVNPAEILSPQPGDTWFIGRTYTIRWKNTVPPETHDLNKFEWRIHLYRPNKEHWDFKIPITQSTYEVKINDVYQIASDYYMQIYIVCTPGIHTCGVPGGSYYETLGPIRIALPENNLD